MSDTNSSLPPGFNSLLASVSAFRNTRALVLLGLTFVIGTLAGGVLSLLGAQLGLGISFLGFILSFLVFFYGGNGVGILLMADAQGQAGQLGIRDAVLLSLCTSHRLLGVALLYVLIVLAVVIAVALVLLICKIPLLGPLLYVVAFPVSAVVLGVTVFSLYGVLLLLAGPAVWNGSGVFEVISRLNRIVRRQLIMVLLSEVLLMLITGLVALFISAIVAIGSGITSSLSAGIIGFGRGGLLGLFPGFGFFGLGASAHVMAGMLGGGLLFALAAVVPALIWCKGSCIIYLNSIEGMDFAGPETALSQRLDAARRKAEQARANARELAARRGKSEPEAASVRGKDDAIPSAAPAASELPAAAEPASDAATPRILNANTPPACPSCHASVAPSDVFCGACGSKLK
jgi:hypothetical protein